MDILAIIPARSGSKGVKNKNLRPLAGKPLIEYAIRAAQKAQSISRLIVSTNDEHIADIAASLGAEVPFLRPQDLARDNTSLVAVNQHAFRHFKEEGIVYDGILSLQPTNPFVETETIEAAVNLFSTSQCDSVTTIAEISTGHPYIAKKLLSANRITNFCQIPPNEPIAPRQKRTKAYYLTGSMYLRKNQLLDVSVPTNHCLGEDARAVVVGELEAVDINKPMDLDFAEYLIRSGYISE
jgi:CMP-N-acetylneuraminic acid synthetase